jgi:hypothetical protein
MWFQSHGQQHHDVEGDSLKGGGSRGHCSSSGAGVEDGRWAMGGERTSLCMSFVVCLFCWLSCVDERLERVE